MTDRELLEAAAKAAGLKIHWPRQRERDEAKASDVGLWLTDGNTCWNPLTDDGDALRLAVKLKLNIMQGDHTVCVNDEQYVDVTEFRGTDPDAAVRRCIVHAAASLGGKD